MYEDLGDTPVILMVRVAHRAEAYRPQVGEPRKPYDVQRHRD
ncbi:MAG: hypothetical protein F4Y02_18230 [Chloroflexi bacterium]|nr:hypothetical protein [Chloroflexota bacterium]